MMAPNSYERRDINEEESSPSMAKTFKGVGIVILLTLVVVLWLYDSMFIDVHKTYALYFDTPIEKVSDLRGGGIVFQDLGFQLCFISDEEIILKDESDYSIVEDPDEKLKLYEEFKDTFRSEKYDMFIEALIHSEEGDIEIKRYYFKDSESGAMLEKTLLSIKSKNMYFFILNSA